MRRRSCCSTSRLPKVEFVEPVSPAIRGAPKCRGGTGNYRERAADRRAAPRSFPKPQFFGADDGIRTRDPQVGKGVGIRPSSVAPSVDVGSVRLVVQEVLPNPPRSNTRYCGQIGTDPHVEPYLSANSSHCL
jgi:hypothetical protein